MAYPPARMRQSRFTPPGTASPARRLRLTVLAFLFARGACAVARSALAQRPWGSTPRNSLKLTAPIWLSIVMLTGCHGVKLPAWVPGPATPAPRLAERAAEVEAHAVAIEQAALAADDLAALLAGAEGIRAELTTILGHALDLRTDTVPAIIDAGHKVDAIAGERDAASKAAVEQSQEVARLREEAASGLRRWLVVLGALALAGMVLSGAGVWFAPSPGMKRTAVGGLIFCGVTFSAAAALHRYYEPIVLIATIGLGVAVLLAIGYGIFLQVRKGRAVIELVQTVEAIKTEIPAPARGELFAKPTDVGVTVGGAVYQIQSPSTVAQVAEVRADMAAAAAAVKQP